MISQVNKIAGERYFLMKIMPSKLRERIPELKEVLLDKSIDF